MDVRRNPATGERWSETLARFVVEQHLGVRVCCHDDRRGTSRPDAIIHRRGGVPLEIVSDPLKGDVELAGAIDKAKRSGPIRVAGLRRGYVVSLNRRARLRDLTWLEEVLRLHDDPETRGAAPSSGDAYEFVLPLDSIPAGEVRFAIGSSGTRTHAEPAEVVDAAIEILARPEYVDVGRKLSEFGGPERHAMLIVDDEKSHAFGWLLEAPLSDVRALPCPALPAGITHLWLMRSGIAGVGLHWEPASGWGGFEWQWGHPRDALDAWSDPHCDERHLPSGG